MGDEGRCGMWQKNVCCMNNFLLCICQVNQLLHRAIHGLVTPEDSPSIVNVQSEGGGNRVVTGGREGE